MMHSESELLLWERGEWDHLPYPVLEAYVDELINDVDQEIVEGHFALCEYCVSEARVLRAERAALARERQATPRSAAKKTPWWLPVFSGLAGASVAAGALWLALVKPLQQQSHAAQSALTTMQAQAQKQQARLTQRMAELESSKTNTTRLAVQQAAELKALRLKVAQRENEKALALAPASPVPVPVPVQVARGADLELSSLNALLSPLEGQGRGAIEPAAAPFALLRPQRTRVRSARPTLSWQPCPGAARYELLIADSHDKVIAQAKVALSQWTPQQALPQGQMLLWEVHAIEGKGNVLGAALGGQFEVLSPAQAAALAHRLAETKTERERARALAEAGLLDEAEPLLESLSADPKATRWRNQIRVLRGRL